MPTGLSDLSTYLDDFGEPPETVLAQARSALQQCIATGEVAAGAAAGTPSEAPAPASIGHRLAAWRWRRLTVMAAVAAVTIAAVVVPLTLRSSAPIPSAAPRQHIAPLADRAATPKGWSAVAYENVQISVPSAWLIESPGFACDAQGDDMVFIGAIRPLPTDMGCSAPANLVSLRPATKSAIPHGRDVIVNSVRVEVGWTRTGATRTYLERGLGMEVTARGPLARRVLGTFTHSPLSVVLGSSVQTPAGWRTIDFGGLQFAVPAGWQITRDSWWGGCPLFVSPDVLRLSTAQIPSTPACPLSPNNARQEAAVPTMVVGAGPQVSTESVPGERCLSHDRLRICIEPQPLSGGFIAGRQLSLLTALVYLPGHAHPDQIEIGLFGSGLTPARIFDSLQVSAS